MSELKVHARPCDIEPMVQIEELREAFTSRLKSALAAKGIPQWGAGARLAKIVSVTPKAASKWLNGEAIPGAAKMLTIAQALDVRIEWLQHGSGPSITHTPTSAPAVVSPLPAGDEIEGIDEKFALIPQYSAKAAAGFGHENPYVESMGTLAFKRDWLRNKHASPKNLIVISVDGDSMCPTINHEDVLLVDKSRFEPVDNQIFVLAGVEGAIVKRLIKSPLGGWIIRSDNEESADRLPLRSDVDEHRVIGQVIWRGGDL
ncbi:S24 family peptidase [Pseudomonas sp. 3A(2025)]